MSVLAVSQFERIDEIRCLDALRIGDGFTAARLWRSAGCRWSIGTDDNFVGTTLTGKNFLRDQINSYYFNLLPGKITTYGKQVVGTAKLEWSEINNSVHLKIGARVMVTRNKYSNGVLKQANGTTGRVIALGSDSVTILTDEYGPMTIYRTVVEDSDWEDALDDFGEIRKSKVEVYGSVEYMPLAHAWAITTHKAQGLTIPGPIQIVLDELFQKTSGLLYVAASRAKDGSQILFSSSSDTTDFIKQCVIDPEVAVWA